MLQTPCSLTADIDAALESRNRFLLALLATLTNEWYPLSHRETFRARETQNILPRDVLVQKSVTATLGHEECRLLWTGVGDFHLTRPVVRRVAHELHVQGRHARNHTLNPPCIDPVCELGQLPGMVSPFFPVGKGNQLAAVVVLAWPKSWETTTQQVAVSLSLSESVIFPLAVLPHLLHTYARHVYPHIPLIEVTAEECV